MRTQNEVDLSPEMRHAASREAAAATNDVQDEGETYKGQPPSKPYLDDKYTPGGATRRAEEASDLGTGCVGAYPGQMQELTGDAHSLNDETEKEMFRTDVGMSERLRFCFGEAENALGARRERTFRHRLIRGQPDLDRGLNLSTQGIENDAEAV